MSPTYLSQASRYWLEEVAEAAMLLSDYDKPENRPWPMWDELMDDLRKALRGLDACIPTTPNTTTDGETTQSNG